MTWLLLPTTGMAIRLSCAPHRLGTALRRPPAFGRLGAPATTPRRYRPWRRSTPQPRASLRNHDTDTRLSPPVPIAKHRADGVVRRRVSSNRRRLHEEGCAPLLPCCAP